MTNITTPKSRAREKKHIYAQRISTIEEKHKRHRRKARIWRRAVKRLAQEIVLASEIQEPINAQTLQPVGAFVSVQ